MAVSCVERHLPFVTPIDEAIKVLLQKEVIMRRSDWMVQLFFVSSANV